MIDKFKIVCITPAGRYRYISILAQYIKKELGKVVDEWHIWQNTGNADDIKYFQNLAQDPRIKIFTTDDAHPFVSGRICSFFKYACEENTVYVRFDDDIVWVEDGAIEKLARFRIAYPHYFLVGGNIGNNPVCSYRQAQRDAIKPNGPITDHFLDETLFWSGIEYHQQFLAQPNKKAFHFPVEALPLGQRFGIQFISWLGSDCKQFAAEVPRDEEQWLTVEGPQKYQRGTALCGDALVVHFAYTEQRLGRTNVAGKRDIIGIDSTDLLEQYKRLADAI